jgi:hypothetical protein
MLKRKGSQGMRTIDPGSLLRPRLIRNPVKFVAAAMLVMIASMAVAKTPFPIEGVLVEIEALPMPALPIDLHEFYLRLCSRGDTLLVTGGSTQGFRAWAALFRVETGGQELGVERLLTISEPGKRSSDKEPGNYFHPAWLRDGRFILYDPQQIRLRVHSPAGDLLRDFDPHENDPHMQHNVYDILVTPNGDIVFAGEAIDDYEAVHVYDSELRHRRSFWFLGREIVSGPGTSMNLHLDDDGSLWVAHGRFETVRRFGLDGELLQELAEPGGYFKAAEKLPRMAGRKAIARWFRESVFLRCPGRLPDGRLVLRFDTRDAETNRWSYVVEIVDPKGRVAPVAFGTDLRLLDVDGEGVFRFGESADETKPWRIRRFVLRTGDSR